MSIILKYNYTRKEMRNESASDQNGYFSWSKETQCHIPFSGISASQSQYITNKSARWQCGPHNLIL